MFTITNILQDIQRGIAAHNMIETYFSYRIIYFVNERDKSIKNYIDTPYNGLRSALENIIRNNLSVTNSVVISAITVRKDGKPVCLQSRSYAFSLDEYFKRIGGESKSRNGNITYGRYAVR